MFKRFCLVLSLAIGMVLLAWLSSLADVDTAWVGRYNGPGDSTDVAYAIAVDGSGNVYVTGGSYGSGTDYDYATIKYYPNGDTAWVRRYNGPEDSLDGAYAIAVDGSGNVYVTGGCDGLFFSEWIIVGDYATIKYDPDGDTAWVRAYEGQGDNIGAALAIAVDGSGNVYVTGLSDYDPVLVSGGDCATIKYYPNGDTAWVRKYNGPRNDFDGGLDVTVDGSGNVYVTGFTDDQVDAGPFADYVTIKYYPNGDTAWVRRYDGPGNDWDNARAIAVDGSGNVYVTGASGGSGTFGDYATIKYDPDGDTTWVKRYDGPGNGWDGAQAIAVDGSGNVYVTGESAGSGIFLDYATIRYYPNGDTAWVRRYNGPGDSTDVATAIAVDSCGNTYVTGYSWNGTDFDYATVKYDSSGNQLWVETYNGPGNGDDKAQAIAVCGCDTVYVTGESWGSGTDYDYATIKYFETPNEVKDETGSREKPSEFTLSQNYPNPFNQTTKIEFTLAKSGFVGLTIYDILGRNVRTLVSEHVTSGYKSVLWDGKNDSGDDVASGIYFYQLKVEDPASGGVGDFTETKKLVLLK